MAHVHSIINAHIYSRQKTNLNNKLTFFLSVLYILYMTRVIVLHYDNMSRAYESTAGGAWHGEKYSEWEEEEVIVVVVMVKYVDMLIAYMRLVNKKILNWARRFVLLYTRWKGSYFTLFHMRNCGFCKICLCACDFNSCDIRGIEWTRCLDTQEKIWKWLKQWPKLLFKKKPLTPNGLI